MAFPDPSTQQYYPAPVGPTFSSAGTDRAQFAPIPQGRQDSIPHVNLQGLDAPRYPVDSSAGDLFKGIGDSLSTVTKAADTVIKDNLEKSIYAGVDKIRGEFGVDEATRLAAAEGGIIPPGGQSTGRALPTALQKLGVQVQGLADAAEAGMSNSYYSARLEVLSKQMREQYAGYRPEIDEIFRKATGQIPANALRTALNQDVSDLQKKLDSKASEYQKFLVTNAANLPQGYENMPQSEVIRHVIDQKGYEHREDNARKPLLTQEGPDGRLMTTAQRSDVGVKQFGVVADNEVNRMFNLSADGVGLSPAMLQKMILDQNKPGAVKWSPDELAEKQGQLEFYEKTIRSAILFKAMKPHQPGQPGNFRGDIADNDKLNKVIDGALAPIKMMKETLGAGQGGLFGAAAAVVKVTKDQEEQRLLGDKTIKTMAGARGLIGDPAMNLWLMVQDAQGKAPIQDLTRALNAKTISRSLTIEGGASPLADAFIERQKAGKAISPQELQSTLRLHLAAATDANIIKSVSPQARANTLLNTYTGLDKMYEAGVIKPENDGYKKFFNVVANPAVTKGVAGLKESNPEVLTRYSEFANRAFRASYLDKVDELQSYVKSPFYEVTWNEKMGGIEVRYDRFKFPNAEEPLVVREHVRRLNEGLVNMAPIWKAAGIEPADALKQVGLDLSAEKNVLRAPSPMLGTEEERKAKSKENIDKQKKLLGKPSSALNFATDEPQNPVEAFVKDPTGGKKPKGRGNLTDEELISTTTTDIPAGVDPAEYLRSLKNRP